MKVEKKNRKIQNKQICFVKENDLQSKKGAWKERKGEE